MARLRWNFLKTLIIIRHKKNWLEQSNLSIRKMVKIIKTNYITSFFIQNILLKYKNKVNL